MIKHNNFNRKHILVVFGLILVFGTLFGSIWYLSEDDEAPIAEKPAFCDSGAAPELLTTAYDQISQNDIAGLKETVTTMENSGGDITGECAAVAATYYLRTFDGQKAKDYSDKIGEQELSLELRAAGVNKQSTSEAAEMIIESKAQIENEQVVDEQDQEWYRYLENQGADGDVE